MKRRDFSLALATAPFIARPARAGAEPVEGTEYTRLEPPVAVGGAGKIEVIEFFGYWCPHCNDLEPRLEAWLKKLPADVAFERSPVAWQPAHEPLQKLYFALQALGIGPEIQQKVFDAVHIQRLHLEVDAGLAAFAAANGIDKAKLGDAMKGFTVASKVRLANQRFKAYRLDGVPALAVNGRFWTSPELAHGDDQALRVTDALIRLARASR